MVDGVGVVDDAAGVSNIVGVVAHVGMLYSHSYIGF